MAIGRSSGRGWSAGEQGLQSQAGDLGELLGDLGTLAVLGVGEPPVQLGQHLLGAAARGADEEDMAEPAFVLGVAGSQQLLSPGVSGGDSGLLPPRPLCLGAPAPGSLADARVGLERPTDLAPVEVACD